jgi:hypothetical protein
MKPFSLVASIVLPSIVIAVPTASDNTTVTRCLSALNGKLPSQTPSDFYFSGNVRTYYVAAEEVEWNYIPTGWDNWLGRTSILSSPLVLTRMLQVFQSMLQFVQTRLGTQRKNRMDTSGRRPYTEATPTRLLPLKQNNPHGKARMDPQSALRLVT